MYVCACIQTHIFVFWNSFHAVTLYLTAVCLLDHLFQAWNSSRTKHPPSICQGLSVPLYWGLLLLLNAVHSCSGSYPLRPVFALHLILHSGQFPPTVSIASTIYSFSPGRRTGPGRMLAYLSVNFPMVISFQPLTGNGVGVFEKSRPSHLNQFSPWDCVSDKQGTVCPSTRTCYTHHF